jgi:hypothetical protein
VFDDKASPALSNQVGGFVSSANNPQLSSALLLVLWQEVMGRIMSELGAAKL